MNSDLLLLYVREDGVFARLALGSETYDTAFRAAVEEANLKDAVLSAAATLCDERDLHMRSVTVAYALSKKVEVLWKAVKEAFSGVPYVDSISQLRREELFYRAVSTLGGDAPRQILYCDSRETRLFTQEGEFTLPTGVTGGNGFLDWLLGFVEVEGDSLSYFLGQSERLAQLFRVYRVYPPASETEVLSETTLFPDRKRYPILAERPKETNERVMLERHSAKQHSLPADGDNAELPIRYFALSDSDRARVDRKYPALYRSVRDRRGNYRQITMEHAAQAFRRLFGRIEEAPLSDLVVVGAYAKFPLTTQLLSSLPQRPQVSYASESKLLLDAMAQAVRERIAFSRLSVTDMDGDEVVLWDADAASAKRISFSVTLRETVTREAWQKNTPILPYTLALKELYKEEDGTFVRRWKTVRGDLRAFCYKRKKDGSYRLALPISDTERETESAFRTALIGISATPLGVVCHLLTESIKTKDSVTPYN